MSKLRPRDRRDQEQEPVGTIAGTDPAQPPAPPGISLAAGDRVESRRVGPDLFLVLVRRDGYRATVAVDSEDVVRNLVRDFYLVLLERNAGAARALMDHLARNGTHPP